MFNSINIHRLIYCDIETVPMERNYQDLPDKFKAMWRDKKLKNPDFEDVDDNLANSWQEEAALYPEYGKIVCIVIGLYARTGEFKTYRINWTLGGEKEVIEKFNELLDHDALSSKKLIAHNGKGFDYPWIIKRALYNNAKIHPQLHIYGKKPWEMELMDSAEIWKMGAYGGPQAATLDSIATCFGLPSPKEEMSGKHVWKFFYNEDGSVSEEGIKQIDKYCTNDVISLAQVIAKMVNAEAQEGFEMPQFVD